MKKEIMAGLSSMLFPMALHASLPASSGAYQRSYVRQSANTDQPLLSNRDALSIKPPQSLPDDASELDLLAGQPVRELIVIDAAVADKHVFYREQKPRVDIVELNDRQDGLKQLQLVLAQYHDLQAVHIISHAKDGWIQLGDSRLNTALVKDRLEFFASLNGAIHEGGDLLFYGCELAAGKQGEEFLDIISNNTHVDIAASNNLTGNPEQGGDWDLEIVRGDIDTDRPFSEKALADFSGVLAFTGTINFDTVITAGSYGDSGNAAGRGDGSVNAEIGGAGGYTLVMDGQSFNTYVGFGYGTSSEDETLITLSFSNNESFSAGSIGIWNLSATSDTFVITGSAGGSTSQVIANGGYSNINLSGLTSGASNITIAAQDGAGWVYLENFSVSSVTPANTAPTVGGVPTDVTVIEDTASNVNLSAVTFADADGDSLTVTLAASGGIMTAVSGGGVTVGGSGTGTMTLAGTAANINTFLDTTTNIKYTSVSNANGNDAATLTLSASDGTDSLASNPVVNLDITAVNDEPTLSAAGSNPSFNEGGTAVGLFTGASIGTVEAGQNISQLTLTVTNVSGDGSTERLVVDGDNVSLANGTSGTTTSNSFGYSVALAGGTATVTLTKTDTTANWQTLVNGLTYQNTGSGIDSNSRVVTITSLKDNGGTANSGDDTNATLAVTSTVTSLPKPTITSATYDASSGALVVTGANMSANAGALNDIDVSRLTFTGEGGAAYTLTSTSDVEISSATQFSVYLNATDKAALNPIMNKDGTGSTSTTTYNIAAADDWVTAFTTADSSDNTGNAVTVSNVAVPAITSATYDAVTGALVVTGTGFSKLSGATNDIDVTKLTLTGEGAATRVLTSVNVEITSGTEFTVTLNAADKAVVNQIFNKNGAASTSATTYNLAAAEDWAKGAAAAVNVVDATGNGITVSNVAVPAITSATYDASTGALVVTGTGFLSKTGATNDIIANKFTFTGEGGATHTLTDSSNVEITSGTAFTITLSATDKAAINQMVNKNGTVSTSGTTYNINAAEDWAAGADAAVNVVDATGNSITVSNVAVPTITSATYNYNTNVIVVTGTGFLGKSGATNDIDISKLTFTGEGAATYTLTSAGDVEIASGTQFSITLAGADLTNVEALLNADGVTSSGSTTYNLAAAEDWAVGADAAVNVVDATGNSITVSNYAIPTITSATYDWSTGQLVITGTEFVSKSGAINDVDASLLTFTGEGGTYVLTDTSDVDVTSATSATVTLSATDKLNVHGLLNKNGTTSSGASTYNLAAADNWLAGSPAASNISDATGNAITVSNVATPTITSMTYDSDTGVVVVTGTNLFKKVGANNDVDLSKLTFTGGTANATYTLTTATDVEITSATSFTFTLTGSDKTNVDALLDQIGTTSSGGSTYNIAAADDWLTGADVATNISDATGSATVSINPKISSSTYNPSTGALVVTGTNIQANGGGSDIDASLFTITGEGGATYTLTDTSDVNRASVTQFTLTLSATDKTGVNALLNNAGTSSADATTYNLAAADNWNTNVTAGDTSDATASITVPNTAPTLTNLHGDTTTFSIAGAAVNLDNGGNATFADLTSPDLSGGNVTVSIIVNEQAGEDQLLIGAVGAIAISGSNVTHTDGGGLTIGTFVGGTGGVDLVITLNANATPARVQDLIRALQYFDSDGATGNTAARVVTITVNDGDGGSSTSSGQDILVNLVRAPIIDLDGDDSSGGTNGAFTGSFTEGGGAVAITDTDTTISDDGSFKALSVIITNDLDGASESLSSTYGTGAQVVNTEAVTIAAYNSGTGELAVTVDDASTTAATMQLLMQSIRYNNTSDTPNATARSITFSGTDNADNVGPVATATISMTAVNDAPTYTGLDGTPAFTEGGAAAVLDGNVTVADLELDATTNYNGATLTLVRNGGSNSADVYSNTGSLSALTQGSSFNLGGAALGTVTTNSAGTLVLTFNATATDANIDSIMQQIAYRNSSDAPVTSVQINWSFSDGNSGSQGTGGALAATGSTTTAINVVNDAPIITSTAGTTATVGSVYTYTATVTDPDDANDGTNLTWSLTAGAPAGMTVSTTGVVSWTPSAAGSEGPITLQVADGGENAAAAATENFSITVAAAPPSGPPANILPTGSVILSGDAIEDQRLEVSHDLADGNGLGDISYRWLRDDTTINGIVGYVYFLTDADVGATISAKVLYTDGDGYGESVISNSIGPVVGVNDAPVGSVVISGTAKSGQSLTADITGLSDVDGLGEFSYQWQRNNTEITGATVNSYTLTDADAGAMISISVSYTDGQGTAESISSDSVGPVETTNTAPQGSVSISGTVEVGETLSASHSLSDEDGLGDISYQWYSNGTAISGATASTYLLSASDLGATFTVTVSFTDGKGNAESVSSQMTAVVTEATVPDGTPPVVTAPDDVTVDATGLFTRVDLGVAVAEDSAGNPLPVELAEGDNLFTPGKHTVIWKTEDSFGETATDTQVVSVKPLVSFSSQLFNYAEGNTFDLSVVLNGNAANYPVTVSYTVSGTALTDGSDHNINDGVFTIEEGTKATISVTLVNDGPTEGLENIILEMGEPTNAAKGVVSTTQIKINENNVAPSVDLKVQQNDESRLTVSKDGGSVVISAKVADPNNNDIHTFLWSSSDGLVESDGNLTDATFSFDPSSLTPGVYKANVVVSDGVASPVSNSVLIDVQETLVTLGDEDTDGDLIPDDQEGHADDDRDGIPDYLDAISDCNVVPEQVNNQNGFLVEGDPGACLRKGSNAMANPGSGLQLDSDASNKLGKDDEADNVGGIFDFIAYGLPEAGQTYQLVIPQNLPVPSAPVYRKFSQSRGWFTFESNELNKVYSTLGEPGVCPPPGDSVWQEGLTEGHWCVQLQIEDGGPNDDDGEKNGAIVDPGGVAQLQTQANDTVDDVQQPSQPITITINGSGGGNLSPWLLAVLGLFGVARIKGRKS